MADWKQHKKKCNIYAENNLKAIEATFLNRMELFADLYHSPITCLLYFGLHNPDGEWIGDTHIIHFLLKDASAESREPHLEIQTVEPVPPANLQAEIQIAFRQQVLVDKPSGSRTGALSIRTNLPALYLAMR